MSDDFFDDIEQELEDFLEDFAEDELQDLEEHESALAYLEGNNGIGRIDWFTLTERMTDLNDAVEKEAQAFGGSL